VSSANHVDARIASEIDAISRISSIPTILEVIAVTTGLRVAFIARVTEDSWTACAVLDRAGFGLARGDQLAIAATL
jgi:hypothetical protein